MHRRALLVTNCAGPGRPSVGYVRRSGMVERRRDADRVEGSDSVPGPKEDHANESDLHHIEGEGREGIDQWSDKAVVLSEEDEDDEDDSESALDINYDEDDGDLKTDGACASNAIALAAKKSSESRPSFGNIVVNSSSDVHFGNKTFYNGPVTIKQFVYTTRDCSEPGDTSVGDKVLDPVTSGQPNGKEQCPTPADENVLSVTSIQTLTSEPSPEINGSFLPIWQPSRSDQPSQPIRKSSVTQWVRKVVKTRRCLAIFATLSTCAVVLLVTLLVLLLPRYDEPSPATDNTPSGKLTIVNRRTWLAQPPVRRSNSLQHPVPIVVILHTATENCSTQAECVYLVRHTQTFHIESNGWNDIGYSFMVGGDGNVYEGRGWDTEGAFARGYNNRSIGIAFIVNPIVQVISGDNAIPHQGLERAITAPSQEPGPPVENKRGGGILEVAPLWLRQHPFIGIGLSLGIVSLFALCLVWAVTTSSNNTLIEKIKIVTRPEWLADDPIKQERPLEHPVQYVVILHTAGEDCPTQETCSGSVRNIQALHIHTNGWSDIGYSFLVGGDGNVYEGRGWDTAGAFARGYNHLSIGIGFIGTFIAYPPVPRQIQAGQQLISKGVELGKISPDYKLVAHMQIRSTESPGLAFFEIIKTWPHWLENP